MGNHIVNEQRCTVDDIIAAYDVMLGRRAESFDVCLAKVGQERETVVQGFWGSSEFLEGVLGRLMNGSDGGNRFSGSPQRKQIRWLEHFLPFTDAGKRELATARSWPQMYAAILRDPGVIAFLLGLDLPWKPNDFLYRLDNWKECFRESRYITLMETQRGRAKERPTKAVPADFNADVYLRYADVRTHPLTPVRHYLEIGALEGRVYSPQTLDSRRAFVEQHLDATFYRHQRPDLTLKDNVADDWIFTGAVTGLSPTHDFSPKYYVKAYPDIADCGLDPFEHFQKHGRFEGRSGRFDFDEICQPGGRAWQDELPAIAIVCHEASRTGAPLVGLALLRGYQETYNVILVLMRAGELIDEFERECAWSISGGVSKRNGIELIEGLRERFDVTGIVFNSVEATVLAEAALVCNLPSVGLIHEFAGYTLPLPRMIETVELLDVVVTPADLIAESIQEQAVQHRGGRVTNIIVRPQGYLPREQAREQAKGDLTESNLTALLGAKRSDYALVLGAGTVQMRKGTDLFIQIADQVRKKFKKPVKFVWVGHGYDPGEIHYCVWLKSMVDMLDLQDDFLFAPPQKDLDFLIGMADVFVLSSRMDPFPNVALDAFAAGKPVVCFDRATGIADAIRMQGFAGGVAPFCDAGKAADLVVEILKRPDPSGRNRAIIAEKFDFQDYADDIVKFLGTAQELVKKRLQLTAAIQATKCFDASFYVGGARLTATDKLAALSTYASRAMKGIVCRNPRPGFNEAVAVDRNKHLGRPGLLLHAGEASCPATHRSVDLEQERSVAVDVVLPSVLMHLHMHYPDLAGEYVSLLNEADLQGDIVITTHSKLGRIECEHAFLKYRGGEVSVVDADNIGRDIAPFVQVLPRFLSEKSYDIVGHFHGKKSLSISQKTGDIWRSFLTSTLIGDADNLAKILQYFASDKKIGLIFAEDCHYVGWTKNRPFAEDLAKRLRPVPAIPNEPVFPIGTMFWVRTAALRAVWENGDCLGELPGEPLPYDGSVLHAFERMIPSIVEAEGYDWMTVHRGGKGW